MAQLETPQPLSNPAPGPRAPKRSGGVLPRPRLLDALRVLKPLTLVSAPAGYGKTVLVDSWIARFGDGPSIVHLGLHGDAVDPVPFWSTVVRLLRSNGIDVPDVPACVPTVATCDPWRGGSPHSSGRSSSSWTVVSSPCRQRSARAWTGSSAGAVAGSR